MAQRSVFSKNCLKNCRETLWFLLPGSYQSYILHTNNVFSRLLHIICLNTMSHCLNCAKPLADAAYCPACGQIATTARITGKTMWQDFLKIYLNLDKGLVYTFKQVFTRPGTAARNYVAGQRIVFIKPLTFVAIASAAAKASVHRLPVDFSPWFKVQKAPETLVSMVFVGTVVSEMFIKDRTLNFWERLTLQMFVAFGALAVLAGTSFVLPKTLFYGLCYALPVWFACFLAIAYWQFFKLWDKPMAMVKATFAAGVVTILGLQMLR
jgi:hypothetical protein